MKPHNFCQESFDLYKMYYKMIYVLLLWTVTETFILSCYGRPHNLNNFDPVINNSHSEEAINRLLRVFGLDGKVPQQRSLSLPPQYMLDLYKSYSDHPLTEHKLRYRRANTVRSFFDKGESIDGGYYFYDLTESIPNYEEVVDAEFHFFTNLNALRLQQSLHVIQIQLYEVLENTTTKLLQARMVTAHSSGWEVFRVKSSVKKWFSDPKLNMGLNVKVLDSTGNEWSNRRLNRLQNHRRPILVVFSRDPRTVGATPPRKTHDFNSLQSISEKENKVKHNNLDTGNPRSTRSASVPENELCARHELKVDFDKLGWSSWIISPKSYDAFVCTGACAFPLGQNQRPSNHATVQSIVHELGLAEGVGAPCCVPTELHPVSLLYFDEHSNVVLKQYDDMVAAGCGCQ